MLDSSGKIFYRVEQTRSGCRQIHIYDSGGVPMDCSTIHLASSGEVRFTERSDGKLSRKNFFYVWFILSGMFVFERNDKVFELKPGDIIFTRPNDLLKSFRLRGSREGIAKYFRISPGFHISAFMENAPFFDRNVFHPSNQEELLDSLKRLEKAGLNGVNGGTDEWETRRRLSCLTYEIFTLLIKGLGGQPTDKFSEIVNFMMRNLASRLTLGDIEKQFHIERHTLARLVKNRRGSTPMLLLRSLRLEYSTRLLKTLNSRIEEIAMTCGFPDSSSYSRLFRKYYGISPLAYRKKFSGSRFLYQYSGNETTIKTSKTEHQEKIFQLVNLKPHISRAELAEVTGLSLSGVDWNIRCLKKKGLLNRFGTPRKGRWHPVTEFRM